MKKANNSNTTGIGFNTKNDKIKSDINVLRCPLFSSFYVIVSFKVGFENGVSRRTFCIALAVLHIVLVGISTCFLLPARRIVPSSVHKGHKKEIPKNVQEKVKFLDEDAVSENKGKARFFYLLIYEPSYCNFFVK